MAKFLDARATAFQLAELIFSARSRLVLINPLLKFSGRTKELLAQKTGTDSHVVFGKSDLHPEDIAWLRAHSFIRTHFCRSLTAKFYVSDDFCIVSSLDLFDFGQVTNNEAGVLIARTEDPMLYADAAEEADRILAASEEVRITMEKVERSAPAAFARPDEHGASTGKLSTHRLAKKLGLKTHELLDGLQRLGAIEISAGEKHLTPHGMKLGGEFRSSARFGDYFVWPEDFELRELAATTQRSTR